MCSDDCIPWGLGAKRSCLWRLNRGPEGTMCSEMRHDHTTRQAKTHIDLYPSSGSSCLLSPQTLSLFGELIMKSIPHYFSNNVANKKKSYFDGVWFSAKRRVKIAILSAALWKCFSWSQQFTGETQWFQPHSWYWSLPEVTDYVTSG